MNEVYGWRTYIFVIMPSGKFHFLFQDLRLSWSYLHCTTCWTHWLGYTVSSYILSDAIYLSRQFNMLIVHVKSRRQAWEQKSPKPLFYQLSSPTWIWHVCLLLNAWKCSYRVVPNMRPSEIWAQLLFAFQKIWEWSVFTLSGGEDKGECTYVWGCMVIMMHC